MQRRRRFLVLSAAGLAFAGAGFAAADGTIYAGNMVTLAFSLFGIAAAFLALWPGSGDWSKRRRTVSAAEAIIWVVAVVPLGIFLGSHL